MGFEDFGNRRHSGPTGYFYEITFKIHVQTKEQLTLYINTDSPRASCLDWGWGGGVWYDHIHFWN